jgi:hypothetical protein
MSPVIAKPRPKATPLIAVNANKSSDRRAAVIGINHILSMGAFTKIAPSVVQAVSIGVVDQLRAGHQYAVHGFPSLFYECFCVATAVLVKRKVPFEIAESGLPVVKVADCCLAVA